MRRQIERICSAVMAGAVCLVIGAGCSDLQTAESPAPTTVLTNTAQTIDTPEPTTVQPATPTPAPAFPVTLTGYDGAEAVISSADRIVSLSPVITSIRVQEGAGPRVVGADEASGGLGDVTRVGTEESPDTDAIIALSPDLVLVGQNTDGDVTDALRAAGVPVLCAEAGSFGEIPDSFLLVGRAAGVEDAGAALTAQREMTIGDVAAARPAVPPSCYYVMSFGRNGNWTSGPGSLMNALIEAAGGVCVTEGGPEPSYEFPVEELAAVDPDCIIFASTAGSYADLIESEGYKDLTAVRNGRVFAIREDLVTEPGPSINEALLSISSILNEASETPAEQDGAAPDTDS